MLWGKENVGHTTKIIIQNSPFLFRFAAWEGRETTVPGLRRNAPTARRGEGGKRPPGAEMVQNDNFVSRSATGAKAVNYRGSGFLRPGMYQKGDEPTRQHPPKQAARKNHG